MRKTNRYIGFIELESDYQVTNGVVWDVQEQKRLLASGLPCIYTDSRFNIDGYCYPAGEWRRNNPTTVKAAGRWIRKLKGLRKGMKIELSSAYIGPNSQTYTVKKPTKGVEFKADRPELFLPFDDLTEALRDKGFLVFVYDNRAVAHGHGLTVGWSKGETWPQYDNVVEWIEWDVFDKWGRGNKIPMSLGVGEVVARLLKHGEKVF